MASLKAMISLAIDTSAHLCAAAVHDLATDAILAEASEDIGRGHAERLMDVISGVLAAAGVEYSGLSRVIVTVGPGSFTGVRVGLATARGIALGLGVDVCGVSVLEAAAEAARQSPQWMAGRPLMVGARRKARRSLWPGFWRTGRGSLCRRLSPFPAIAGTRARLAALRIGRVERQCSSGCRLSCPA